MQPLLQVIASNMDVFEEMLVLNFLKYCFQQEDTNRVAHPRVEVAVTLRRSILDVVIVTSGLHLLEKCDKIRRSG